MRRLGIVLASAVCLLAAVVRGRPEPSGRPQPRIEATAPSDPRERPASGVEYPPQSPSGLPASWAQVARFAHSSGPYHDVALTTSEANAYFAGPGAARLPAGVSRLVLAAQPGVLSGTALVDFDQLAKTGNPLLQMFSGEHRLAVRARVDSAQAPRARLTVTEVRLDGAVVPNWLLDAAARSFLQPKYPTLGRHFSLPLPRHATSASVGDNAVVLHYPGAVPPAQGAGRG